MLNPTLEGPLHIRDIYPGDIFIRRDYRSLVPKLLICRDEERYGFLTRISLSSVHCRYEELSISIGDYLGTIWYRVR